MKKVIVKRKVGNREKFIKKLEEMELGFGRAYYQHDRVYVPRNYRPDANYARIVLRTELADVNKKPRYRMILKRHIDDSSVDVVYNTVIRDYTEAVQMVHQLGFEKKAEISRRREEMKLGEGSVMYLDKVEGLNGYYAKIENDLSDDEKVGELREDLEKTFEILGLTGEMKETYADAKGGN